MFLCSSEEIMESLYNFEGEECDHCNPCYIFCDSTGEDLCKPYKDRIFYNGARQIILPSITKVLRSCNKVFNRLSHRVHTEPPECCCQRRIRDHGCTCFCYNKKNEVCQCRRKYEDSFRIVEVADASLSSTNLGISEKHTSENEEEKKVGKEPTENRDNVVNEVERQVEDAENEEERLVEDAKNEEERLVEDVENEEERLVEDIDNSNCVCKKSPLSVSEEENHCEKNCPKDTRSTSESDREICSPCARQVSYSGAAPHNEIDKDYSRNININVKVRLHKKKKRNSEPTSVPERKKCKCKRKLQGEIHKDMKKKCKCEISKPIVICNKKPESGPKFLNFFKCKNLDENIKENVERICACGKERLLGQSKSERERASSNESSIFIPTTKPIDPKMLSTIREESNKFNGHAEHHSENYHSIKLSKGKMKSVTDNHEKINTSDTPSIRSVESSKNGIEIKNHNQKRKNGSDQIIDEVEDVPKDERKYSLEKEKHDNDRKSRKSRRSLKHLQEPSHTISRMSRPASELIKKDPRMKSVTDNHAKMNIPDTTSGDTHSKILSNKGKVSTEPHLENIHSVKSSKNKIEIKNHNHKEKNGSAKIVDEVEGMPKDERKHSLEKKKQDNDRESRKSSRSLKHLQEPSHTSSRIIRPASELIKKDQRMKSVNDNHEKINILDTTKGDNDSKMLWNRDKLSAEPHLASIHSVKSFQNKIEIKNHSHTKTNRPDKIVDVPKDERKHSLENENYDNDRKSRKSSRSLKYLQEPSHTSSRLSRPASELINKDQRKNEPKVVSSQCEENFIKSKDTGYGRKSLDVSTHRISSEFDQKRNETAGSSGDLIPLLSDNDAKRHMSFRFPLFNKERGAYYLFQGNSHCVSYLNWYHNREGQSSYSQMKTKWTNLIPTPHLPRIMLDRIPNETTQRQTYNENNEVSDELRCPKSNFDYQQIYDLREIFRKFEIYKQQQFIMEYTKLKQSYDYEIGNMIKLHKRRRKFRLEDESMRVLKILAVHCLLVIYFVIFVWFTFFD